MKALDYSSLATEQVNPRTGDMDTRKTEEIITLINQEDKTVADAVEKCIPDIARAVDVIVEKLKQQGRVFYVGAGTSGRIGALDAFECPLTYGVDKEMIQAIVAGEGEKAQGKEILDREDDRGLGEKSIVERAVGSRDVVIGISASGTAPFVLAALEEAKRRSAFIVGICNTPDSPLNQIADISIIAVTGPESITGSTRMKAGTSQKMVVNMLSTASMVKLGKVYQNLMVDLMPTNSKLVDRATRIIMLAAGTDRETAAALLEKAGHTKTAIVMQKCGCGREDAIKYLSLAEGFVSKAVSIGKTEQGD